MLALLAAALATSAPAPASMLEGSLPWWEKISVTLDDKGNQQSCRYQSSLSAKGVETCGDEMAQSINPSAAKGVTGVYSKLTFERRFSPGEKLDSGRLQAGDKLLGQQVMFLTIGDDGAIQSCRVVGTSGDLLPAYGCDEARSEQFRETSAPADRPRRAFMTIMVYGHQEQIA